MNIIAFFSIVKAAVDHMAPGSCIINMSSVAGAPPGSLDPWTSAAASELRSSASWGALVSNGYSQ